MPNKQGKIKGTAAVATALGPNLFTDIAYETGAAVSQLSSKHAFVASAAGAVFQVNYTKWVRGAECWGRGDAGRGGRVLGPANLRAERRSTRHSTLHYVHG